MEWVERLRGQTIGLDTSPLIYFIEQHQQFAATVNPFFEALERGDIRVVTSVITLLEVLVHPLRLGNARLAADYRDILLNSLNVATMPVTEQIAEQAAELRAKHRLATPDAIQLATSLQNDAAAFLTGDRDIPAMDDLPVLKLSDLTLPDATAG